jgi:hypothetical protein
VAATDLKVEKVAEGASSFRAEGVYTADRMTLPSRTSPASCWIACAVMRTHTSSHATT